MPTLFDAVSVSRDSHGGPKGVVQIEGNDLNRHAVLHLCRAEHTACTLPVPLALPLGLGLPFARDIKHQDYDVVFVVPRIVACP